jgi:hypothetical protein
MQMAITIFTIPPMSVGPERVFSGDKHTIAPERIATMGRDGGMLKELDPGRHQAPLSGVF